LDELRINYDKKIVESINLEKELLAKLEDIKSLRSAVIDSKSELERKTLHYETIIESLKQNNQLLITKIDDLQLEINRN
jgi:hypothetical protein